MNEQRFVDHRSVAVDVVEKYSQHNAEDAARIRQTRDEAIGNGPMGYRYDDDSEIIDYTMSKFESSTRWAIIFQARRRAQNFRDEQSTLFPALSDSAFLENLAAIDEKDLDISSIAYWFNSLDDMFLAPESIADDDEQEWYAYHKDYPPENVTDLRPHITHITRFRGTIRERMADKERLLKELTLSNLAKAVINICFQNQFARDPIHSSAPFNTLLEYNILNSGITIVSSHWFKFSPHAIKLPNHKCWAIISDDAVVVKDPNFDGLQGVESLEPFNLVNATENGPGRSIDPGGWCTAWSLFAMECAATGSSLHDDMIECCKDFNFTMDTDLGKRVVELFDPEGAKLGVNTMALTMFIRKYVVRVISNLGIGAWKSRDDNYKTYFPLRDLPDFWGFMAERSSCFNVDMLEEYNAGKTPLKEQSRVLTILLLFSRDTNRDTCKKQ